MILFDPTPRRTVTECPQSLEIHQALRDHLEISEESTKYYNRETTRLPKVLNPSQVPLFHAVGSNGMAILEDAVWMFDRMCCRENSQKSIEVQDYVDHFLDWVKEAIPNLDPITNTEKLRKMAPRLCKKSYTYDQPAIFRDVEIVNRWVIATGRTWGDL